MRLSALFASCTIACLAAIPTVAAAPENFTGDIAAQSITAEGDNEIDGLLLALYRLDVDGEGGDVSFDLQAGQVDVVTYSSDPAFSSGQGWVAPVPPGYEPETRTFADAVIASAGQTKPGYKFSVVAAQGAHLEVESACATFDQPDRQQFEAPQVVGSPAEPVVTDVSGTVHWTTCGTSNVVVTGNFVIDLWQIDAFLTSGNETEELRSGFDKSSVVPDPAAGLAQGAVSQMQQQYLYVHAGRMTFTMDASPHHAFVQAPMVETDGRLTFVDAVGEVRRGAEAVHVAAGSLTVEGPAVSVQPRLGSKVNQPLETTIAAATSAEADGQPLSFASSAPATQGLSPWLFGLIGAVLVPPALIPVGRRVARHRRLATVSAQAQELLNLNRCHEAEPLVDQLARMAPGDLRVRHQQALVLECRGDYQGAVEARRSLDVALQAERIAHPLLGENRFQLALLGGRLHRRAVGLERAKWQHTALRYLREAVNVNPSLADYVPLHPELAGLHPDLRATSADQLFTN